MRCLAAIPFVVLLLPLLCGIVVATVLCPLPVWLLITLYALTALLFLLAVVIKPWRQSLMLTAVMLCLFALGQYRTQQQWETTEVDYLGENHTYELWVQDVPQAREKTIRCEAQVVHCLQDSLWLPTKGRILLYLWRDSLSEQLQQGDCLLANTTISRRSSGNPAAFDYASYLREQGIAGTAFCYADAWEKTTNRPLRTMFALSQRWRQSLLATYQRLGISGAELGVLCALTLGDKSLLDADTKQAYSVAGAMHVLAVSGLHVGIIYGVIWLLLTGFGLYPPLYRQRIRRIVQALVLIVALWLYAFLTGLSPSVMRSALMLSLVSVAVAMGRQSNIYNTIAASAFICLIINPLALFSVSFCLSYSAVLAIVYYQPRLYGLLPRLPWGIRHVWNLLTVSIAAQIGTIPFTLYYFGQTSNYFALTNLFVIPMATIVVYTAFFTLLFSWAPFALLPATLLRWELQAMNAVVGWIERLPFATTALSLNTSMLCLLIAFILCLTLFCRSPKWYGLLTSVVMLMTLLGVYYHRIRTITHSEQFVVCNINHSNLLLHRQGNTAVAYTDDSLVAAPYLQHYAQTMLLQQLHCVDVSGQSFFSFSWKDSTYLLVRDSVFVNKTNNTPIVVHGLLLGDIGRVSPKRLFDMVQPEEVFLMPSMRPYKTQQMQQYMDEHAIPYHTIANGAIIIE